MKHYQMHSVSVVSYKFTLCFLGRVTEVTARIDPTEMSGGATPQGNTIEEHVSGCSGSLSSDSADSRVESSDMKSQAEFLEKELRRKKYHHGSWWS